MQVRYLDGLLEWLDQQDRDEGSPLHGIVDMTRIGTAGHSRGAKLACLQFAGCLLSLEHSALSKLHVCLLNFPSTPRRCTPQRTSSAPPPPLSQVCDLRTSGVHAVVR